MKNVFVLIMILMVAGCATVGGQSEWYAAQKDYMIAQQTVPQRPLFEMKAVAGTSIQNLESLSVFAPITAPPKELRQYVETPHPAWGLAGKVTDALSRLGGYYFLKEGIETVFDSFTKIASVPSSSYTQNISGDHNTGQIRTMGDVNVMNNGDENVITGLLDETGIPTIVDPLVVDPLVVNPVVVDPVVINQPEPIIIK